MDTKFDELMKLAMQKGQIRERATGSREVIRFKVTRASLMGDKCPPCLGSSIVGKDEFNQNIWGVSFNSLQELLNFIKQNGKIVIGPENDILIYDSWIE